LNEINAEPDAWSDAWDKPFYNQVTGLWEFLHIEENAVVELKCPYGAVGDRLYVREKWRVVGWHDGEAFLIEYADGTKLEDAGDDYDDAYECLILQCCEDCDKVGIKPDNDGIYSWPEDVSAPTRWRPSIHMPKWASRIWLEITDIRAERVQDISAEDAIAEGWPRHSEIFPTINPGNKALSWFQKLWDSINAKRGCGWENNCWVWVISFKVLE
jgi:hypothetical protein